MRTPVVVERAVPSEYDELAVEDTPDLDARRSAAGGRDPEAPRGAAVGVLGTDRQQRAVADGRAGDRGGNALLEVLGGVGVGTDQAQTGGCGRATGHDEPEDERDAPAGRRPEAAAARGGAVQLVLEVGKETHDGSSRVWRIVLKPRLTRLRTTWGDSCRRRAISS